MNNKLIRHSCLAFLLTYGITSNAMGENAKMASGVGDALVVVKQVVGTDSTGKDHVLYGEQSGRIYRLDNIEQAVFDLSSRGIREKGNYHSLRAVLDHTVFVMDGNQSPRPERIEKTGIQKVVELKVNSIMVSKDNVIAIYSHNCQASNF